MELVTNIQRKFADQQFEFSRHALDQMLLRMISAQDIREAIRTAELIEDYPNDKYGPSCLLLGFTRTKRALHIQCSHPSRSLVKVITVYEPNLTEWNALSVRKN